MFYDDRVSLETKVVIQNWRRVTNVHWARSVFMYFFSAIFFLVIIYIFMHYWNVKLSLTHALITTSNSAFSKLNNNHYTYKNSKQPSGDYITMKWKMHNDNLVTCIQKWHPYMTCIIYLTVLFKSNDKIIQWANYRKDWSDLKNPALNVVPGLI